MGPSSDSSVEYDTPRRPPYSLRTPSVLPPYPSVPFTPSAARSCYDPSARTSYCASSTKSPNASAPYSRPTSRPTSRRPTRSKRVGRGQLALPRASVCGRSTPRPSCAKSACSLRPWRTRVRTRVRTTSRHISHAHAPLLGRTAGTSRAEWESPDSPTKFFVDRDENTDMSDARPTRYVQVECAAPVRTFRACAAFATIVLGITIALATFRLPRATDGRCHDTLAEIVWEPFDATSTYDWLLTDRIEYVRDESDDECHATFASAYGATSPSSAERRRLATVLAGGTNSGSQRVSPSPPSPPPPSPLSPPPLPAISNGTQTCLGGGGYKEANDGSYEEAPFFPQMNQALGNLTIPGIETCLSTYFNTTLQGSYSRQEVAICVWSFQKNDTTVETPFGPPSIIGPLKSVTSVLQTTTRLCLEDGNTVDAKVVLCPCTFTCPKVIEEITTLKKFIEYANSTNGDVISDFKSSCNTTRRYGNFDDPINLFQVAQAVCPASVADEECCTGTFYPDSRACFFGGR